MWVIAKYNKGEEEIFKKNLKILSGKDTKFYSPCFVSKNLFNKKTKYFKRKILINYIFCYNKNFLNINFFNSLKFIRGLTYFLSSHHLHQSEIINFLKLCKRHEDENGYLKPSIFKSVIKDKGKFITGPFKNILFNILEKHKNKIEILLGDINVKISDKGNNFYQPL